MYILVSKWRFYLKMSIFLSFSLFYILKRFYQFCITSCNSHLSVSLSFTPSFCHVFSTSPFLCLSLLPWIRNGICPMTAFRLPCPQQSQQETVKSPDVTPLVKSPTPEPAELETRRVRTIDYTAYYKRKIQSQCQHFTSSWCLCFFLSRYMYCAYAGVKYCSEIVPTLVENHSHLDLRTSSAGYSNAM